MFLADFHVHSTFSDGKLSIPQLVDLYGKHGFGAIAVTDHLCEENTVIGKAAVYIGCSLTRATYPRYLEILAAEAERAWQQYQMVVIPGVELTKNTVFNHRSAHVLGLGITEFISADGDVRDLTRAIRTQGGISIAAHPVWTRRLEKQTYYLWDRKEELTPDFDAWEVASGPHFFHEVVRANLPKIASSDLHVPKQMKSWKTVLSCQKNQSAILDSIRRQKIDFRYFTPDPAIVRQVA